MLGGATVAEVSESPWPEVVRRLWPGSVLAGVAAVISGGGEGESEEGGRRGRDREKLMRGGGCRVSMRIVRRGE